MDTGFLKMILQVSFNTCVVRNDIFFTSYLPILPYLFAGKKHRKELYMFRLPSCRGVPFASTLVFYEKFCAPWVCRSKKREKCF